LIEDQGNFADRTRIRVLTGLGRRDRDALGVVTGDLHLLARLVDGDLGRQPLALRLVYGRGLLPPVTRIHLIGHFLHLRTHLLECGFRVLLLVQVQMQERALIEEHDLGTRSRRVACQKTDDLRLHFQVAVGAQLVAGDHRPGGARHVCERHGADTRDRHAALDGDIGLYHTHRQSQPAAEHRHGG
jgi:hypothetical protein